VEVGGPCWGSRQSLESPWHDISETTSPCYGTGFNEHPLDTVISTALDPGDHRRGAAA